MINKYGTIPEKQVIGNEEDLINQVFKLLPYKEDCYEDLDYYFTTLLFRIAGLNKFLNEPSELITVMSLLESARVEENFKLYRKAVLDSCSIIRQLQKKAGD